MSSWFSAPGSLISFFSLENRHGVQRSIIANVQTLPRPFTLIFPCQNVLLIDKQRQYLPSSWLPIFAHLLVLPFLSLIWVNYSDKIEKVMGLSEKRGIIVASNTCVLANSRQAARKGGSLLDVVGTTQLLLWHKDDHCQLLWCTSNGSTAVV